MRLFGERLHAPLVYVLRNTIWPQVLSIYFKPSVSCLVLTVGRLSSHFHPPDSLSAEEKAFRKEQQKGSRREGWGKKKKESRPGPGKTKMDGVNEHGGERRREDGAPL